MYRRDGGLEVQASRFNIIAPPGNDDSDEEGQVGCSVSGVTSH